MINFRVSQQKPQMNSAAIQTIEYNTKLLFVSEHCLRFKIKKFWYKFKKAFAFGQRYQKYNQKYQNVKKLLKDARKLKKAMFHV